MQLFSCLVVQLFAVVVSWNCTCQHCWELQNKAPIDVDLLPCLACSVTYFCGFLMWLNFLTLFALHVFLTFPTFPAFSTFHPLIAIISHFSVRTFLTFPHCLGCIFQAIVRLAADHDFRSALMQPLTHMSPWIGPHCVDDSNDQFIAVKINISLFLFSFFVCISLRSFL